MPRQARIVALDCPHHVTQRGNRRAPIFFESGDQDVYRRLLARETRRFRTLRLAELTGRPAGGADFVADVERRLGRVITPRRRGRPSARAEPPTGDLFTR